MNRLSLAPPIFTVCLTLAFSGNAGADNVHCVKGADSVPYAARHCGSDPEANRTNAAVKRARLVRPAVGEARDAIAGKTPTARHALPIDAATLKTARSSMLRQDGESAALRRNKLTALESGSSHWFNF